MQYYALEPWGPERADLNAGIIASIIANVNRDAKRRPEPFKPSDFMPQWGVSEAEPEEDGMAPDRVMKIMDGMMKTQEEWLKKGGRLS